MCINIWKRILYMYIYILFLYNKNPKDRWMKGCIIPFHKKGDHGLAKKYCGIILTSIVAKIYNALLRNRIEPKIDNILKKDQNGFRRNRSTTSQILTIRRILEGVRAKKLTGNNIICQHFWGLWLHSQRKVGENSSRIWTIRRNGRNHNDAL